MFTQVKRDRSQPCLLSIPRLSGHNSVNPGFLSAPNLVNPFTCRGRLLSIPRLSAPNIV